MTIQQADLTTAQVVDQFRLNSAILHLFVNGTAQDDVVVDSGTFPTIAKLIADNESALLAALSRQDIDTLLETINQKATTAATLAGYGILDGVTTTDPRLGSPTIKQVRQNAGPDQYSSIADALASINDASATNRYLIDVAPGVYVEPQLVMQSYVAIEGSGEETTSIVAADPNTHLIVAANHATVHRLELTGATGMDAALVYMNEADQTLRHLFRMTSIKFGAADTLALTVSGYITLSDCTYGGDKAFRQGFVVANTDNRYGRIVLRNCTSTGMIAPYPDVVFRADGTNCQLSLIGTTSRAKNASMVPTVVGDNTVSAQVGIHLRNGGYARGLALSLIGFQKAIWVENAGAAPILLCEGVNLSDNVMDLDVDHPSTVGNFHGSASRAKVSVPANLTNLTLLYIDLGGKGLVNVGPLFVGHTHDTLANIEPLISRGTPIGLMDGGVLTKGAGLNVNVSAGTGYVRVNQSLVNVAWDAAVVPVVANATVYVYVDKINVIRTSATLPDAETNVILGRMLTSGAGIVLLGALGSTSIETFHPNLDRMLREAIGPVYASGSVVSANATNPLAVDVTEGHYFFSSTQTYPQGRVATPMYCVGHSGGAPALALWTALDNTTYDNGTNMVPLTAGHYTKHVMYTNGSGDNTAYLISHGTGNFATLEEAVTSPLPLPALSPDGSPVVAAFVVQEGVNAITQIIDLRPRMGFAAASSAGTTNHGDLLGLTNDHHPQYLLVNGVRPMNGDLDMDDHAVVNAGPINGVNVAEHAARHLPNGDDPLTTAAPTTALSPDSDNALGVENTLARSDHSHEVTGFQIASAVLSAVAAIAAGANGVVRRAANGSWTAAVLTSADMPANVALPGTGAMLPPVGTTATRPAAPAEGHYRYNSLLGVHEGFTPDGWVSMTNVLIAAHRGNVGQLSGTTRIALDSTVPLVTEGSQLWTKTVTPTIVGSVMSIEFSCMLDGSSTSSNNTIALFRGNTCIAIAAAAPSGSGGNKPSTVTLQFNDTTTSLTPLTYQVRVGNESGTWYVNRGSSATFGGTNLSGWKIDEVLV